MFDDSNRVAVLCSRCCQLAALMTAATVSTCCTTEDGVWLCCCVCGCPSLTPWLLVAAEPDFLAFRFAFFFWFLVSWPGMAAAPAAAAAAGAGVDCCTTISQWRGCSVSSSITFSGLKSVWIMDSCLRTAHMGGVGCVGLRWVSIAPLPSHMERGSQRLSPTRPSSMPHRV